MEKSYPQTLLNCFWTNYRETKYKNYKSIINSLSLLKYLDLLKFD